LECAYGSGIACAGVPPRWFESRGGTARPSFGALGVANPHCRGVAWWRDPWRERDILDDPLRPRRAAMRLGFSCYGQETPSECVVKLYNPCWAVPLEGPAHASAQGPVTCNQVHAYKRGGRSGLLLEWPGCRASRRQWPAESRSNALAGFPRPGVPCVAVPGGYFAGNGGCGRFFLERGFPTDGSMRSEFAGTCPGDKGSSARRNPAGLRASKGRAWILMQPSESGQWWRWEPKGLPNDPNHILQRPPSGVR